MKTAKEETLERVAGLPDDATTEQILSELHFQAKISRGLAQFERGETASHEEVMAKVSRGLEQAERGEIVTQGEARNRLNRWLSDAGA